MTTVPAPRRTERAGTVLRVVRAAVLLGGGYAFGRAAAALQLDRRAPIDLRELADDVERRQFRTGLPRRPRLGAGAP